MSEIDEDNTTTNVTTVIILASDKKAFKKSLIHVDQFLKKVGERIETERGLLGSVRRRNIRYGTTGHSPITIDGVSNEDYANLWFGGNKYHNKPKLIKSRKQESDGGVFLRSLKGFPNFYKAVAALDEDELKKETTMTLANAVQDLKGLMEPAVDFKNNQNSTKLDAFRKIQAAFMKRSFGSKVVDKSAMKKSKRENDDEFDVFGGMDFPEDSNLPNSMTTKARTTGGGVPPDVLDNGFIEQHQGPGPGPEAMVTPFTTIDNEPLLDPQDFGDSTTHRTLPTYGDIGGHPKIDTKYLTTPRAPEEYVANLQAEMEKFQMGVFSIAILKVFHMIIWKSQDEGHRIVQGFGVAIHRWEANRRFHEFGQPAHDALTKSAIKMTNMPYDEVRSEVVVLHNGMLHRRELFSKDVNSLIDHIDSLYTPQEKVELLKSLKPLEMYNEPKEIPKEIFNAILEAGLAPWSRLKGTPRGNILSTALNRAIKNHFYFDDNDYRDTRRSITINIPVEFVPRVRPETEVTPAAPPPPNFGNAIKVYRIETRRDDLNKNIYNTDLQTILNNFLRTRNEQARKSVLNINAKPLFNKQLKSNLNIVNNKEVDNKQVDNKQVDNKQVDNKQVDNKQVNNIFNRINQKPGNPIRINLNAKATSKPGNGNQIMIITSNNQAKNNIINKPRAIFRSGGSYIDYNVLNINDTLVPIPDHFELDMYPDLPMISEQPQSTPPPPSELNFQIDGHKLNLQVDGDKKVIVINKKGDAPMGTFREDIDLTMNSASSSSSLRKKKHHKKHHKKHKRTHGRNNLKEKLAKIKKIVRMYRSGHKKSKHKRHHRRGKHKKAFKSLSIKEESVPPPPSPFFRNLFNVTKIKTVSDRRFQIRDSLSTNARSPPVGGNLLGYTTQVYAVRSKFINSLRRNMMTDDVNKDKWGREVSEQSDEEIALRRNLYKAMSFERRGFPRRRDARRANKRRLLRDSSGSDEEAVLKNKIYSYFNNILPE